ncbi:hypothetical protein [Clostridium culturomicium]|uniref:hypothetical protein n=1 Tax=Clostridium culturomicium TaxID=1499683 RepID=UPI00385745F3
MKKKDRIIPNSKERIRARDKEVLLKVNKLEEELKIMRDKHIAPSNSLSFR